MTVPNIKFHHEIPYMESFQIQPSSLLTLDDLMSETNEDVRKRIPRNPIGILKFKQLLREINIQKN